MKTLGVIGSLCLASAALAATDQAPIIGGNKAQLGQFPSVVAIQVGNGLCTGTLVTKDWVLTAAHCLLAKEVGLSTQADVAGSVRVHFGTVDLHQSAGRVVSATEAIPNPSFNIDALGTSDIGLIKLATPVSDVTPIGVNLDAAKAPVGVHVTMVGFGRTGANGQGDVGIEYVVEQTSMSCGGGVNGGDASLLCFSQVDGKGKCSGDSGGPSFAAVGGKQLQVGITSFGDDKCTQYGADTRTDAEREFIVAHVPELASDAGPATPADEPASGSAGCTHDADCASGACSSSDGEAGTCLPSTAQASTDGGGCNAAGGRVGILLAGLVLAGLAFRRRS